jgi:hypothetical protein
MELLIVFTDRTYEFESLTDVFRLESMDEQGLFLSKTSDFRFLPIALNMFRLSFIFSPNPPSPKSPPL